MTSSTAKSIQTDFFFLLRHWLELILALICPSSSAIGWHLCIFTPWHLSWNCPWTSHSRTCSKDPSKLVVRLGDWNTKKLTEILPHHDFHVTRAVVHEKLNKRTLFNTVALLFLESQVCYASFRCRKCQRWLALLYLCYGQPRCSEKHCRWHLLNYSKVGMHLL